MCLVSFIKDLIKKSPSYDSTILKVLPILQDLNEQCNTRMVWKSIIQSKVGCANRISETL